MEHRLLYCSPCRRAHRDPRLLRRLMRWGLKDWSSLPAAHMLPARRPALHCSSTLWVAHGYVECVVYACHYYTWGVPGDLWCVSAAGGRLFGLDQLFERFAQQCDEWERGR